MLVQRIRSAVRRIPGTSANWQSFRIPWTFSFTDDLFSDPVAPPDPSSLSRRIVGGEHHQIEVPDQSEVFEFGTRQHGALQQRWNDFETTDRHLVRYPTTGVSSSCV